MKKQEKMIILRVDDELKNKFNQKANDNYMTLSARIKYLMKLDIDKRLIFKNENV